MITFQSLGHYGRLGNQLFQIASTIGIAKKYNFEFGFPNWNYEKYFNLHNCFGKYSNINLSHSEKFQYYYEIPKYDNMNLFGYFQSWKYFEHCKQFILDSFKIRKTIIDKCFIHVRRGDYLLLSEHHPNLTLEYYNNAIFIMEEKGFKEFIVMSDDIHWCKHNFLDKKFEFHNGNEIEDLYLMMSCKAAIIANSSFSWWGAYLGNHDNVIAPKNYFGKITYKIDDIISKNWITI